jgi:hypothetical protein
MGRIGGGSGSGTLVGCGPAVWQYDIVKSLSPGKLEPPTIWTARLIYTSRRNG